MIHPTRRMSLLGASLVLLASASWSQVTICPGGWTTGTTHAAGAGNDRLLVVALGGESSSTGANDFTAVTYGDQSMTLIDRIETTGSSFSYVGSLWYLDEAGIQAATNSNIVATVTGPGFNETSTAAVVYCNVDQANPIGNVATAQGSGGSAPDPITASIDVDVMHAAVAAAGCRNSGSFTWTQDLTEATDQQGATSTFSTADTANFVTAGLRTASAEYSGNTNLNVLVLAEVRDLPPPPVAALSGTPLDGVNPLEVTFTDLSSGGPVTDWAWDFGDGGSSTEENPVHTYTSAGTYSVGLTVTGPGGSDTATEADYVVVTEAAPVPAFSAMPLSGYVPLEVAFTNLSTGGPVTDWAWDFGDGEASTEQEPVHTYASAGTYTVSLTATGPGGSDTATQVDYILVDPLPVFADGGFELQTPGMAPMAPWSITAGAAHLIHPNGFPSDNGMPTDGSHWAEVSAEGTNAATPPSNPGGEGSPPVGAAGISQTFTLPPTQPHIYFTAAFVLSGLASSTNFNDFMSVDVTDGVTTHNLYYADTFSSFGNISLVYSAPMTDVAIVAADLSALFPASDSNTVFTLTIQAGNGGDDQNSSRGFVDRFGFAPTAVGVERNGTGVNTPCLMNLTPPAIGTTWTARVDHSGHPGAAFTILVGRSQPSMGFITQYGEVLITGLKYYRGTVASSGTFDDHDLAVPVDLGLAGLPAYVQAIIVGGAGPELCNAIDCLVGF